MKEVAKIIIKLVRVPKLFDEKADLTSNVAINKILSPVYFFGVFYYLHWVKHFPLFGKPNLLIGSFGLSLLSTFFYIFCSYFFQPDLDVRLNRPGMNTFPFGTTLINSSFGFFLQPIQYVLSRCWHYLFMPYAKLSTHRGVTHYPILSVWLRVGYLLAIVMAVKHLLIFCYIKSLTPILTAEFYLRSFYPWEKGFGNYTWLMFCFPVYLSDLAHEVIDYWDSKRKGLSYCPPLIPRGLVNQSFKFLRLLLSRNK